MIGRLAQRLGFSPSVPVSVIDDWITPIAAPRLVELAPRGGDGAFAVDEFGRLQPKDASWTLDWTVAGGARFVAAARAERVSQRLIAPAVIETTFETPAGKVLHRVAAGVVDAKPVAIVEIENAGGVAVAVGLVVRPLRHDGRGYVNRVAVDRSGIAVDGASAVRFATQPAVVRAYTAADGDLLQAMPEPNESLERAEAKCRAGGAQAAAVWPLPHTATLRMIVELGAPTAPNAAVPATDDVNRGWRSHLERGLRADVDGLEIADTLAVATRTLLTLWPRPNDTPAAITALAESGFGRDVPRLLALLERAEADSAVVGCVARWVQLADPESVIGPLESVLGVLARAAHGVAAAGGRLAGDPWTGAALDALAERLTAIGQPDVASRIAGFGGGAIAGPSTDRFLAISGLPHAALGWPGAQMRSAAELVLALRSLVIEDTASELRLLPELPVAWRGRSIDVFGTPVQGGSISFGLRWHGPRPALFWEVERDDATAPPLTTPGVDPTFSSTERQGEVLLADPGWPRR